MEKPKIIVCATAYRPFVGGAEIAIEEVAGRLAGDFDFIILTARMSRDLARRESAPEGTVIRLGFGTRFDKWLLPFLVPWYVFSRFRILDSRFLMWGMDVSQGALGGAAIKTLFPRVPFIFTVQYGESEEYLQSGRGGLIGFAFRRMLARADAVTAISSYLLGVARTHGYCGPAAVIHNGVDGEKFESQKLKVKRARNGNMVITVSRLVRKNGVDILIRAIGEVRKQIPGIQCRIAGDGPERLRLAALASELGVGDAIVFLGTVPHTELARHLHEADVFVRMSRSEGMGNAFAEAAAAGVPVVATAVGGIPDIIEHEKTGLFAGVDDSADCARKITRLLRDPAYAEAMAGRAREKIIQRFDWDTIARRYRDIFYAALGAEKRITIATGLFPPDIGGPATYTALLADELPREKIAVRVSYFGGVRHLPRIARHLAYFLRLLAAARGSGIIFAQDPVSVGLPALAAARLLRRKFFLKIVGDYAWEQYMNHESRIKNKEYETPEAFQKKRHGAMTEMRRRIQQFVARRADKIIVPSRYLRRIVAGWGVAQEKIAVVYNAVAMPERRASREEAREQLGLSGVVIIAVGRLVPWKGFAAVIDAIADLAVEMPDLRLVIAGSGPEEENLRRIIAERDAGERVRMTGAILHDALMEYFSASDIFVLNSGYEGLSHTLIEAMVAGLPVVATNIGGNPEVTTDGVEGILIPYDNNGKLKDALRALAGDKNMRLTMGAAARARAAAFTREKMIRETAVILRE